MSSLADRRILITGATGFLGRAVMSHLRNRGANPIPAPPSADCDLVESSNVARLYRETQPDVVVHLAARVGGIGANRQNPGKFFYDNLMMGLHLIEHARRIRLSKFVQIGTICAYPKHAPIPFREDDLWNGYPEETNAPYGIAKKALLVQAQSYRAQYGLNAIYLLPVNLYGPGDNFDLETSHVIPAVIRKAVEAVEHGDDTMTLWGSGSPTREFLHVEDAAEGIALATEKYDGADPVNLGSGHEISIRDLAREICNLVGFRGQIVWDSTRPDGQPRRSLDVSRAERFFGFRARTPLLKGLQDTIDWYRSHRRNGR